MFDTKEFENTLQNIGCILIETVGMSTIPSKAYIPDSENFLELLRTMQGKIVIFTDHQGKDCWYYVVFHGLTFYTTNWIPSTILTQKSKEITS